MSSVIQEQHKKRKRQLATDQTPVMSVEVLDSQTSDRLTELRQKIPLITVLSTIEATNKMNSTELRLRRWFKCTKFDEKCFATRNSDQQFLSHLADKHPDQTLFCLYCNAICANDNKQYYTHEELVDHIRSEHCFRQYQCNLCLYRAISVDHILIHQESVHSRNFEATLLKAEINGEQEAEHKQNQTIKECKVLECKPLTDNPLPEPGHYFQTYKHKQINGEHTVNQCVYCPYMDANKDELYAHCVAAHPDYPILFYPGISPRHATNGHKEDDAVDHVEKVAKKRTFNESFSDSDVTTNGVVDTYEFEIWTESEDEDMLLSEDDLSLNVSIDTETVESAEPMAKKQKVEISNDGKDNKNVLNRTALQQTPYYVAACVSALLAVYFSVVVMTGR